MERFNYKGITFAEGIKTPFADFKKLYASTEAFKSIPHKKREAEMKRVYKELQAHTSKQLKEASKNVAQGAKEDKNVNTSSTSNSSNKN